MTSANVDVEVPWICLFVATTIVASGGCSASRRPARLLPDPAPVALEGAGEPFLTVTASATSAVFGGPPPSHTRPSTPPRAWPRARDPRSRDPVEREFLVLPSIDAPQGCVGSRPKHRIRTIALRHTEMSAANVLACLDANPTSMCSGPPTKARLMPSQKLAIVFSQSIPIQRLRRNAAVRLLETEARDSAAYAPTTLPCPITF